MTQASKNKQVQFSRISLALRVLLISVIAIALPLLIFFFYIYEQEYAHRLESISTHLTDLGKTRAEQIAQLTRYELKTIDIVQAITTPHSLSPSALSSLLADVAKGGGYASIYYIALAPDNQAHIIASSDPKLIGTNVSEDQYIEMVLLDGKTTFLAHGAALNVATSTFQKYLYVAKLVDGGRGIITIETGINTLIDSIISPEKTPYPIQFSLVTEDGIIFTSSKQRLILRSVESINKNGSRKVGESGKIVDWDGTKQVVVTIPIQGTALSLLVSTKESAAYSPLLGRIWRVIGVFALIFIVGGWAALWLTIRMSLPMRHLSDIMNRVSEGDLTARYNKRRFGFEVNVIGQIFNDAIDSLRSQMARAESERIRREGLDEEFRIGREMQRAILPRTPPPALGFALAARYLPAKQVGGDFYDFFRLPRPDRPTEDLVLTVADASGKGISACLFSLLLRSMLRSFVITSGRVSDALRQANNLFCEDTGDTGMFVTAITAIYRPEDRTLSYSSCGHPPGLLRKTSGAVESLTGQGMAMGILPMETLEEEEIQLASGDLLVLYSDGITEAQNKHREFYGEERLRTCLMRERGDNVEEIADRILADVHTFCDPVPPFDDITLLLLKLE